MADEAVAPVAADLYFLMQKFLSGGPLTKTLEVFQNELAEFNLLPKRTDWSGNEHERTVDDMEQQYPLVRPDYLLQLCCRASSNKSNAQAAEKVISLFSLNKRRDVEYNFNQLLDYVKRHYLIPVRDLKVSCNLVNIVRGREISGPIARRWIASPKLYSSFQFQRRTLGHLSAVYCLLFDHSGQYIVTGADDLLIKLWSSRTGRLIASFRGASSEITDIAINVENTLLAAGSIDRILRIWDLQTGVPVAVLTAHTGMITSVNFCPSTSWNFRYLISTSTDGSVAFWAYTYDTGGKVNFRSKPTVYQEKMRPGQAQMICSSFSAGGTFLATGSADHHVRVYYMRGDEGPHRILETEAHTDRVDSIQWAHSGLRFMSGSKDGTAIIWRFESQQWKTLYLYMTPGAAAQTQTNNKTKVSEEQRKLKVTMVTWDQSDNWAVTAVSDHRLKIWSTRSGELYKVLSGHTDEVYCLEAHPHDSHVILSAGHDGLLYIWDIIKGEMISKFENTIEHQGFGAIFDVRWAPDGNSMAASDSHGHILIFGFGNGDKLFEQLPKELFFHTDYRPLVRDANNHVLDEQTQVPPHLMPPPFLVDIDGNPYPPMLQRLVVGREHCKTEQLVPSIVIGNEGNQEVIQVVAEDNARNDEEPDHLRLQRAGNSANRNEGIRQSTGDWQNDPNMKWKKHVLVQPLKRSEIARVRDYVELMESLEMQEYRRQLCQRPHMINTGSVNDSSKSGDKKKSSASYQTRNSVGPAKGFAVLSSEFSESDLSDSSGHSDWVAEENVNLQPQKRPRRRVVKYNSEDEDDEEEDEEIDIEDDESDDETGRGKRNRQNKNKERDSSPEKGRPSTSRPSRTPKVNPANMEAYRTSEWLTEVRPRKTPYYPQMGDMVVYFPQGHHLYLDAIRSKKVYEINSKTLPWTKMHLRGHEFAKVMDIQYEIKPPRICNLKLALLDEEGRLTGKIFNVKYHDMPDVLDFFVLKQNFDAAMSRDWQVGDRFRCMIDDGWWIGEIVTKTPPAEEFPNSPFLCYEIKWDNGELERMSPWDMEPIDDSRTPENTGEALPVLEEELKSILYQPTVDDWPNNDRETVTGYVLAGLSKVMELAIAEPFLVPVDLAHYPTYVLIIEYPIDLSTIKARFENRFYRRVTAAQFDMRHLALNAEKFNERHSVIVKHARILTELCLRIVKQCTMNIDVTAVYHQLVDTYDSTDTEVDVEILPSSSRMLRSLPNRYLRHASDWVAEAKLLFEAIWDREDSAPFRTPVNTAKYTDYHRVIQTPMDLSIVKEKLFHDKYENPNEFYSDVKLIFQNSRIYNTNQRSRIYVMTVNLAAIFEEHINKIIRNWKTARRRSPPTNNKTGSATTSRSSESDLSGEIEASPKKQSSQSDSEDDLPLKRLKVHTAGIPKIESEDSDDEDSSSSSKSVKKNGNNFEKSDDDSDGSYKPSTRKYPRRSARKKRGVSTSSDEEKNCEDVDEDEASTDSSDDGVPLVRYNGRSSRNKNQGVSSSKRKRVFSDSDNSPDEDRVLTSVSSRGRVRKLNPRVTALMKK